MAKLSPKEKLVIQRENVAIKKSLAAGGLKVKEKINLQRQWKDNLKKLEVKAAVASNSADDIIARYLAGAFNSVSVSQFIEAIDAVDQAGATLNEVKQGAQSWVTANEALLAA